MGFFDVTNTFTGGTQAVAGEVNENFDEVNNATVLLSLFKPIAGTSQFVVDFNMSAGSFTLTRGAIYFYSSFTMTGGTINTDGIAANNGLPIIIVVDGDVNISGGTFNLVAKGHAAGGAGSFDQNGGDGIGTDLSGIGATAKCLGGGKGLKGQSGGPHGTGGAGGAFVAFPAAIQPDELKYAFNVFSGGGGGGGGGAYFGSGQSGGNGGAGGGALIFIVSGNFSFTAGTINCSGVNGVSALNEGGGGGGGGAGDVLVFHVGTYTGGGTYTQTGGSGASGGTPTHTWGGGGGGGGGGSANNATAGDTGNPFDGGDGADGNAVTVQL